MHRIVTQVQLIDWERDLINLINNFIYYSNSINNYIEGARFAIQYLLMINFHDEYIYVNFMHMHIYIYVYDEHNTLWHSPH